jgi:P4 family phage/plasmid primase-like protien
MLDWALRYIGLGWAVLPLKGKLPLVEHGLTEATLNEAQVRAWWSKWPWANIGLVTGGAFFVLDIDIKKDGEETWDALRMRYGGAAVDTLEAVTGSGGRHIFFAMPGEEVASSQKPVASIRNSVERLGPGLDIRGVGGYVVASPSVHPETKRRYSWADDGWGSVMVPGEQAIAAAPAWLLKLIQEAAQRPPSSSSSNSIPEKLGKGQRNDKLFRLGSSLRARGFEEDEIFASLVILNKTRCEPPLDEAELRVIAQSAAKYERGRFAASSQQPVASSQSEEPVSGADIEKAVDDAIAQNNLQLAVSLAADVAKLPAAAQVLAKTKFRMHFGKAWRASDFDDAVRQARRESKVEMPAAHGAAPQPREQPPGTTEKDDLLWQPLTDSGNGERITHLHGRDMRWCTEMKNWIVWDGRRWAVDEKNSASQRAKETARKLYFQAVADNVKSGWARKSESNGLIKAALERAATEPGVAIAAAQLDTHPYLLNCQNGVVDLRTGELLPHDRGYLITKLCPVTYDPGAKCERWLDFVLWAMGQNPEAEPSGRAVRLLSFLQKAFGYAASGDVSEKCVFILYGPSGDNGKTTMLNAIRRTLGKEYCAQLDINTLMASKMTDSFMRADLAALRGARFVITSEVESGSQLGEAKLKYLTGMGEIKTKRLYENPIDFEPTHKLFMDCNYRPKVKRGDDALWQRMKSIPFTAKIDRASAEFDANLIEKLEAEAAGILAWIVRGAVQWKKDGLGSPPEIVDAATEWRDADDPLGDFIEDCCEDGGERWVQVSALSQAYAWWCQENREARPLGRVPFVELMKSKGYEYSRSRRDGNGVQLRTWEGIGVREGLEAEMALSGPGKRQREFVS